MSIYIYTHIHPYFIPSIITEFKDYDTIVRVVNTEKKTTFSVE